MHIGAIFTLPVKRVLKDNFDQAPVGERASEQQALNAAPLSSVDVLGSSLLERMAARLSQLDAVRPVILREHAACTQLLPARSTAGGEFMSAWESAVAKLINAGVEILCLTRVSAYSDLDIADLLGFHMETGAPVTQAYASDGSLDIAMVTTSALRGDASSYRKSLGSLLAQPRRYAYSGYVNRMRNLSDLCRLSKDGLYERCGLRPTGTEILDGVWVREQVHIDEMARIIAPAFIGAGSRIGPDCVISGGSSIERNCEIDCGTSIHESCILPDTYVGVALNVQNSIVKGGKLYHVSRRVEVAISDERLIGINSRPASFLSSLDSRGHGVDRTDYIV